jgi:hypothetical protein
MIVILFIKIIIKNVFKDLIIYNIMISYLLIISLLNLIYAFNPSCTTCKFFVPHQTNPNSDLGLCKMFKDKVYYVKNDDEVLINNLAVHCRNNENLCGKAGFLYEPINSEYDTVENYEFFENLCCGEFTDKKDLEELDKIEKELFDVFEKMRKHNTLRIYKTSKEIYKLFKRNRNFK